MDKLTFQQNVRLGLAAEYGSPIVTLALNLPRACPHSPDFAAVFAEGMRELRLSRLSILGHKVFSSKFFAAFAVDKEAAALKRLLMHLEGRHPLGRLWDFDVYVGDVCLSGASQGRATRTCFLCQEPALVCRRLGRHSRDELYQWFLGKAQSFVSVRKQLSKAVEQVGIRAKEAILKEAKLSPKPGLVDSRSSGVHRDMDLSLLLKSGQVIAPYLMKCADLAARRAIRGISCPQALFRRLKTIGLETEEAMFALTEGVNTHKGMIFSLGLLCGAAGTLIGRGEELTALNICQEGAAISAGLLTHFEHINDGAGLTKGESNYYKYNSQGIRGEVNSGFPSVLNHSLPELVDSRAKYGESAACVRSLLSLISIVDDSNILYRSGPAGLEHMQNLARGALEAGWPEDAKGLELFKQLEEFCLEATVSPGGSADLLAVTLFLDAIVLSC